MDDEIILVKPSIERKKQAINFIEEVEKADIDTDIRYAGFSGLQKYRNNYEEWLNEIERYSKKKLFQKG